MQKVEPLVPGCYYHIYNRGNNRENIFLEEKNYPYFLKLYTKYIDPVADTFSYCLLRNHFHFLARIKYEDELETSKVSYTYRYISQQFSNMFNAYTKAINKRYGRTGSLFQTRFGRKRVTDNAYLIYLIQYIHLNPKRHKFVSDFKNYPYSSYQAFLSSKKTNLQRGKVLSWFGSLSVFEDFHKTNDDFGSIQGLIEEDGV